MSTTPYRAGSAVEDDLRELAGDLATAIAKARALNLPTSTYLFCGWRLRKYRKP